MPHRAAGPLSRDERDRLHDELVRSMAERRRPVRILTKGNSWHQRTIAVLLRVLTFGGQNRYLSSYVTTLGHTIFVPDDWPSWDPGDRYCVLRHEMVHVGQFERWTWPGMMLFYGLVPFPVGLAWCRARFEMEAYCVSVEARAEVWGVEDGCGERYREEIIRRFTGPDYAWMWPFRKTVEGWVREAQEKTRRAFEG